MSPRSKRPATVPAGAGYPRYGSFWTAPRLLLLGLPLGAGVAYGDASLPVKPTPPTTAKSTTVPAPRPLPQPVMLGGDPPAPVPPTPPPTPPSGKKKEPCPTKLGGKPMAPRRGVLPELTLLHPHEPHEPCFVGEDRLLTLRLPPGRGVT